MVAVPRHGRRGDARGQPLEPLQGPVQEMVRRRAAPRPRCLDDEQRLRLAESPQTQFRPAAVPPIERRESVRSAMDYVAQIFVLMTGLLPKLVAGFAITLAIATAAMPLAFVFGLLLLLPRLENSAVLEAPIAAFIEVMRNTPLLLQIYLVYFGLPLLGFYPSEFTCGVLGIA